MVCSNSSRPTGLANIMKFHKDGKWKQVSEDYPDHLLASIFFRCTTVPDQVNKLVSLFYHGIIISSEDTFLVDIVDFLSKKLAGSFEYVLHFIKN